MDPSSRCPTLLIWILSTLGEHHASPGTVLSLPRTENPNPNGPEYSRSPSAHGRAVLASQLAPEPVAAWNLSSLEDTAKVPSTAEYSCSTPARLRRSEVSGFASRTVM